LARTLSQVKTGLGFSKKRSTWSSWDVERGSDSDTTATVSVAPDTVRGTGRHIKYRQLQGQLGLGKEELATHLVEEGLWPARKEV
jgi:hypothetical protein